MLNKLKIKLYSFFTEGHSRTILAKKNIAITFFFKAGNFIIGMLLVTITINYINPTQYGIWLTLSSLINWFNIFDIGLGNGLKNILAKTNALEQHINSQAYISTTYAILSLISIFIFLLFIFINPFINWSIILNSSNNVESLNLVVIFIVTFFCISFIIQPINTILTATHQPAKSSIIVFIGSFLSLIFVYILSKYTELSLLKLVLILAGIPLLVQIIASLFLFETSLKCFSPKIYFIDFKYAKQLLSVGGIFFVIQIGTLFLFQTNNIVITHLFGPKEVATFNIAFKLFSILIMFFTIIITPFWSSFTDAYTKNDINWIKDIMKKIKIFWFFFIFITLCFLVFSPYFFQFWLGESIKIPFMLSVALTFYVFAYTWQTIHVFLLNGIGKVRLQLYLVIICSVINIPLAIFLGQKIGLTGIIFSNTILFTIMGIIFSIQCNKILKKKANKIWVK